MNKNSCRYYAGDVILTEKPFAFVLKSSLSHERCDHCFERSEQLMKCSGCSVVRYCDVRCQKKGWFFHKRECRNMKRIAPKILPDSVRLLARIIFKLDKGGAREQCFYSARQFRVFMDLMSHYKEVTEDAKRMEQFEALSFVLLEFFGDDVLPNPIELLRIWGKLVVNTYCILDGENRAIGSGMYIAGSVIDHSCNANAIAVFSGTTLEIKTLVAIDNLVWDKVFISYIDVMKNTAARQKELQEMYYFLCECSRCKDVEELGLMNSTVCESCQQILPNGCQDRNAHCSGCGEGISERRWKEIVDIVRFTDEKLEFMKDMNYLDLCRLSLLKQENLFGPLNVRKVHMLDNAMSSSIELKFWESAYDFGQSLLEPYRRYYGDIHPQTGIHCMKLGKLAINLDKMSDATKHLKEAMRILIITHGKKHHIVREELFELISDLS